MVKPFPRYNAKFNYSAAAREIETVKEIIKAVRNVKSQVGCAPSKKIKLFVKTEDKRAVKNGAVYIEKLAGVSSVEFVENKNDINEKIVSQIVGKTELYIPLGELVDVDKEIERLNKELETAESEIARASGKLANKGFLDKAPKALVDAERVKLDGYLDVRKKLISRIEELKG